MYTIGTGTIGDLVGDKVAYRSLRPCDPRLADVAIPAVPPRKIDRAYGEIVGTLLQRARDLDEPGTPLRRLIVVGDNVPTDGAAFENLCAVNGYTGTALLVQEAPDALHDMPRFSDDEPLVHLKHWQHLLLWADSPAAQDIDQSTIVLLDNDKTRRGARGRNDKIIDDARTVAMRETIAAMLGASFDPTVFAEARQVFNDKRFHSLTGDNQDYVGYLCLIVGAGVWTTTSLADHIASGRIGDIDALQAALATQHNSEAERFHALAASIAARIAAGDPTPFKEFRVGEYYETVRRMGGDEALTITERLGRELVLTGEVFDVARRWRDQGALLFALSDKPDEAAIPPADDRAASPLHHIPTHIVTSTRAS